MRREGNEILFDNDEQKRQFVEAITFSQRTDDMIAAAFRAALSLEYSAKTWWDAARKLCNDGEQPVFMNSTNQLVVETCQPEAGYRWRMMNPIANHLSRAKERAVADQEWETADKIRILLDELAPKPE